MISFAKHKIDLIPLVGIVIGLLILLVLGYIVLSIQPSKLSSLLSPIAGAQNSIGNINITTIPVDVSGVIVGIVNSRNSAESGNNFLTCSFSGSRVTSIVGGNAISTAWNSRSTMALATISASSGTVMFSASSSLSHDQERQVWFFIPSAS